MTAKAKQISIMVDMLPEEEQELAYEFVKRIVLAWDPDFTKLTPDEKQRLDDAEQEFENGEYYTSDQINWD